MRSHIKKTFFAKVYKITKHIPAGKVATYGQIAQLAGNPKAAQAVGMAMKNNPDMKHIPCHRVIASDGSLCGYSGCKGIDTKKILLKKEGVIFYGRKVNLAISQWIPKA